MSALQPTSLFGRVAVGVRMTHPAPEFCDSFARLCAHGLERGDRILQPAIGMPHHIAAQVLAGEFWDSGLDSLLMIDDDMIFPHCALSRLRSNPQAFAFDIVSGLSCCRRPPHCPVIMTGDGVVKKVVPPDGSGGIVEVGMVGLAFTLIRRHCFTGEGWSFNWGPQGVGEDAEFCRKNREQGRRIGVDQSVIIGHQIAVNAVWDADKKATVYRATQDDRMVRLVQARIQEEKP